MDEAAEPLLAFDIVDVSQDLAAEQFTHFEPFNGFWVFTDALVLAVDEFQSVQQVCAGDRGGGDGLEELGFLSFEVEGFGFEFFAVLVILLFRGFGD